jgi:hypothetical protein
VLIKVAFKKKKILNRPSVIGRSSSPFRMRKRLVLTVSKRSELILAYKVTHSAVLSFLFLPKKKQEEKVEKKKNFSLNLLDIQHHTHVQASTMIMYF